MLIFIPLCLIEGIFILLVLLINPEILGTMKGMFGTRSSLILLILKLSNASILAITGFLYGLQLVLETDKKIKLKGKFFLIGMISFLIGGISSLFISSLFIFTILELSFLRPLLISSSIEIYFSFLLPDRIARWLIREET